MTRPAFLAAFRAALDDQQAEILTTIPYIWPAPTGTFLRVKVRPGWDVRIPPIADPLSLVWLNQRGVFCSVLDCQRLARELGLNPWDARDLVEASDVSLDRLSAISQRIWRTELEQAVRDYELSPSYAWR